MFMIDEFALHIFGKMSMGVSACSPLSLHSIHVIHCISYNKPTTMTESAPAPAPNPDESEIYDRQIRLWGAEAQVSMRNVRIDACL